MEPLRFDPRVTPISGAPAPDAALAALRAGGRRGLFGLVSGGGRPARHSLLAFDPLPGAAPRRRSPSEVLADLRGRLAGLRSVAGDDVPGPFAGGLLCALPYDLGVAGERQRLPVEADTPPWVGGLYTDFCVWDHERGEAWLVLGHEPGDGRPSVDARRAAVFAALAAEPPAEDLVATGPLVRHTPAEEHRRRIEELRAAIARGDLYQANLAHRFSREVGGSAVALFQRMRSVNAAPYMAFVEWREPGPGALVSASPELLFELTGREARTRPIKGTIGRGRDAAEDRENMARLLASEKDRAELAMIVDLERNDLGRVAVPGSVRVEGFPTLQTYASVHHLVADVVADVRPGLDAFDVLAALFPGGSITGAPKLASMEWIARLEGEGRGFFTGSVGFVDTRGAAAFNILIRTATWRPGRVDYRVGGGITWSSDAAAEDEETLAKGRALAEALEGASALLAP